MTIDTIETFLAVIELGNISLAAQKLFVSQSTVSHRIQLLEKEIGVVLLLRQKGHRVIDVTQAGKNFIPVAQQWISLWHDTQQLLNSPDVQLLSVGAVDSIHNFTFINLYKKHMHDFPNIRLALNGHHSIEMPDLLEHRKIDIGFAFTPTRALDIICKPIYREKIYLVCHADSDYYDNMDPASLKKEDEIYLHIATDCGLWHEQFWSKNAKSRIVINNGNMLSSLLQTPNLWALAPMSVIKSLQNNKDIVFYNLKIPPPPRICYQLTHRFPKPSTVGAINTFAKEVEDYVAGNETICHFEPWMLGQ